MQWLSLPPSEIATSQTVVLHVNFAPSADHMWKSDWLFPILPLLYAFVGSSDLFAQAGAPVQTF